MGAGLDKQSEGKTAKFRRRDEWFCSAKEKWVQSMRLGDIYVPSGSGILRIMWAVPDPYRKP
jgi:hypothetical protein